MRLDPISELESGMGEAWKFECKGRKIANGHNTFDCHGTNARGCG